MGDADFKSNISLASLIAIAVKLNNLCKLLVGKGVITEEELNKLNTDSVRETTNAFLED